jgi:hypothetical protein
MIQNLFLLFIRNLQRQKLFSTINLLGLTVSIASTLLIYLYVSHELSYDSFHHHADRLYRVNQTFIWGDGSDSQFSRTGPGVAHAMKEEFPEVELVTSLHTPGSYIVSYTAPDKKIISFEETEIFAVDTNFFKVLNFPLIKGNIKTAFRDVNTLMLTRSTAKKYFGATDPIGKLLRLGIPNDSSTQTYEVTGIVEDAPSNSTIQFDVLLSNKSFNVERMHWSWVWTQLETFVLLTENANIENVRAKLTTIPKKRAQETLRNVMNISYDEYIASGKNLREKMGIVSSTNENTSPSRSRCGGIVSRYWQHQNNIFTHRRCIIHYPFILREFYESQYGAIYKTRKRSRCAQDHGIGPISVEPGIFPRSVDFLFSRFSRCISRYTDDHTGFQPPYRQRTFT